jgi:hypothetical protein
MVQSLFAALFLAVSVAVAGPAVAAEPTLHEVYQAADSGNLKQAQAMMDQVLRDHPNSAKAHFVEAELLAKQGRADMAKAELATAERLSPGLNFAKPESVRELKTLLAPAATMPVAAPAHAATAGESNWAYWLVGLAVLAAFIFFVRSLMRPRVAPAGYGYAGGYGPASAGQTFGNGPMAPMAGAGGGLGSSMLGGLATGVAVGAGVAAGEALMHRMLDGGHGTDVVPPAQSLDASTPLVNDDMGGADFGVSDGGSWDDGSAGGGDWN